MIRVEISPRLIEWAKGNGDSLGELKNSITHGGGNAAGYLGEALIVKHYGGAMSHTYDHDVVIDGCMGDVKTKRCTSPPKAHYECTVAATSTHQRPDEYFFVRVLEDLSVGWILGYISAQDFFKNAHFHKEGDPDSSKPEWPFKADCYNMTISEVQRLGGI